MGDHTKHLGVRGGHECRARCARNRASLRSIESTAVDGHIQWSLCVPEIANRNEPILGGESGVGGHARIRRLDRFAVVQIVVAVDAIDEKNAGFGVVICRTHDLVPKFTRPHFSIHPLPVAALIRAGLFDVVCRLGLVHQLDLAAGFHGMHERVGDADRDVEVGELTRVLGVDEALDVRMVAAQHAHLRAPARARGFHRLARLVEHAHVRDRPARARVRAVHIRALGTDRREVVTDAAAAAHCLSSFGESGIDPGLAIDDFGDRIADGLDETIDQRCGERRSGRRVDAARRNETALLRLEELRFPVHALRFGLRGSQRARHAGTDFSGGSLAVLGVFLEQHLA